MRCIGTHRTTERLAFRLEATRFWTTCAGAGTAAATTGTVFADVIETTQFACFIIDGAVHIIILYAVFADTNFGWTRFALSNHRLQGQDRSVLFEFEFCTQGFDIFLIHLDAIAALQ